MFTFVGMYSLLEIIDTNQKLHYIPTSTMQDVRRIDATTVRVYTNINNGHRNEYMTYDLVEAGAGAGVTNTTQVASIVNTWRVLLQGNQSLLRVPLPFTLTSFTSTINSWT